MKSYQNSEKLLKKALKIIPLGTQTFSKSWMQYPLGASPFFIKRGDGSRIWDVDGNEYIDFLSGIGTNILGYNDPDVNNAVMEQLKDGTIFPLAHEIEIKVAEKILEIIPWAQKVRFGKNGSDVTTAAIRLARAHTGRDHVAVCGYHGWHDWYIGSTEKNLGVPKSTQELTHKFTFNNIESLNEIFSKYPNQVAAVILEPMNAFWPKDNFLSKVKEITKKNGAILIFDEIYTGFRFSLGGAQELFNVKPDLIVFGKAIANGFPISVIAGSSEIMDLLENDVFFSFTFGGETLSLAAALATMTKLQKKSIPKVLSDKGKKLYNALKSLITQYGVEDFINITGHPSWLFLHIKDTSAYTSNQIKTLFLQEMLKNGILTIGTHLINYAHSDKDLDKLICTYDKVLPKIKDAVFSNDLEKYLSCKYIKPVFSVRKTKSL